MLFDTDILIFVQRGNRKATKVIEKTEELCISIQTYMELLQDANNKEQHRYILKNIVYHMASEPETPLSRQQLSNRA